MRYYRDTSFRKQLQVLRLALAFVDIALHRRGPEQLPASTFLLALALAVFVAVTLVELSTASTAEGLGLFFGFALILYGAFVWSVLKAFNRERRFKQTATALLGTEAFFGVLSLPLLWWNRDAPADQPLTLPTMLLYFIMIWEIDVAGYVLSRAIGRPYIVGVSLVLAYVLLLISLQTTFFAANG
jgi:hypothetical protein